MLLPLHYSLLCLAFTSPFFFNLSTPFPRPPPPALGFPLPSFAHSLFFSCFPSSLPPLLSFPVCLFNLPHHHWGLLLKPAPMLHLSAVSICNQWHPWYLSHDPADQSNTCSSAWGAPWFAVCYKHESAIHFKHELYRWLCRSWNFLTIQIFFVGH